MRISRRMPKRIVIALLAVALLFAQWVGLNHRILHADLPQQPSLHLFSSNNSDDGDDRHLDHSCAAFDAATVGDAVGVLPFVAPLITSAGVLALWAAFLSWDAPVTAYFSSRAPPRA